MKTLLFLACICLALMPALCHAGEEKKAPEQQKPEILAAIELIAVGTTMQDREAANVSLHLGPTSTFITISF